MSAADAKDAIDALVGRSDAAHALLEQLRLQGEWLQRIASDSALATTFLNQTNVIGGTCIGFLRHPAVKQPTSTCASLMRLRERRSQRLSYLSQGPNGGSSSATPSSYLRLTRTCCAVLREF